MNKTISKIFLTLILILSCNQKQSTVKIEYKDEIEHVSSSLPQYPQKLINIVEEISIGGENETNIYIPWRFTVDYKGIFYITDRSDSKIKIFDKTGNFLNSIGKTGKGPNEYLMPQRISMLPGNKLIIFDLGNFRTSVLDTNYSYFTSNQWDAPIIHVYLTTDSSYVVMERKIYNNGKSDCKIKSFSLAGNLVNQFKGQFFVEKTKSKINNNGMSFRMRIPFEPLSIFAGDNQRQYLYHCLNDKYVIDVYDAKARLFRKIMRPYTPLPVTEEDYKDFHTGHRNAVFTQMAKETTLPVSKTITDHLVVDEQSNLWVELHEEREKNGVTETAYDIFDKDGIYHAQVWSSVRPQLFRNGKMYSLVEDEETGFRSVRRYSIEWKEE